MRKQKEGCPWNGRPRFALPATGLKKSARLSMRRPLSSTGEAPVAGPDPGGGGPGVHHLPLRAWPGERTSGAGEIVAGLWESFRNLELGGGLPFPGQATTGPGLGHPQPAAPAVLQPGDHRGGRLRPGQLSETESVPGQPLLPAHRGLPQRGGGHRVHHPLRQVPGGWNWT